MDEKVLTNEHEQNAMTLDEEVEMCFISEMHSDIGICRKVNQDACCVRMMRTQEHTFVMAAVCDGVGGLQEGDHASKSTIQALNNWFDYAAGKRIRETDRNRLIDGLQEEIEQCVQRQNHMLCEYSKGKGIRTGTTLTLLLIIGGQYLTAQIGDSRAYRIDHELTQLTEDQSVVAQEVKAGLLSAEEAKHDRRRNMILQCIGASESLCIVYRRGKVYPDDIFFLCSDGFVHELDDEEIKLCFKPEILMNRIMVKECLKSAVTKVKERGERDNITVVLVKACKKM